MTDEYHSHRNSAFRVWLNSVDDSDDVHYANMDGLVGEKFEKVMRVQAHGFSSVPPADSHALGVSLGGKRDLTALLGGEHPKHLPRKLGSGNSAFYNADGTIMKMIGKNSTMDQSGDHVHTCKSFTIKCGDVTLKIDKNGITITGGTIKHDDHAIDKTHVHTNSGGTGLGGPPQ